MAYLACTISNIALSIYGKKGDKMHTPEEFIPKWDTREQEETPKQSMEDMKSVLRQIANSSKRKKKK